MTLSPQMPSRGSARAKPKMKAKPSLLATVFTFVVVVAYVVS